MATGQRYERLGSGQVWRRHERSTAETVQLFSPWSLFEDFINGEATAANTTSGSRLGFTQFTYMVSGATTSDSASFAKAQGAQGLCAILGPTDATTAGWNGLSWEDEEAIDIGTTTTSKYVQFEARVKVTKATTMAEKNIMLGLVAGSVPAAGTGILTLNTAALFFIGSTTSTGLPSTSDDLSIHTATRSGAASPATTGVTDTGLDMTDDTYRIFRIDLSDKANVKFYVDGTRVNSGTTYDLSGVTAGANALVQPIIIQNRSATGTPAAQTTSVDYVKLWGIR